MLRIIQDVERGEACKIEVEILKERIHNLNSLTETQIAIIQRQRLQIESFYEIGHMYQMNEEVLREQAKKAKSQRNGIGLAAILLLVLLVL